ncbi:MAG: hypothetical protein DYH15_00080 [Nitrosomonas sp. PRO4]|nr:hypothetical protein [Nitrosomonas sp. PRO4]
MPCNPNNALVWDACFVARPTAQMLAFKKRVRMKQHIETFFDQVRSGEIEIYNEFSLQHELGIFLRNLMPNHKV